MMYVQSSSPDSFAFTFHSPPEEYEPWLSRLSMGERLWSIPAQGINALSQEDRTILAYPIEVTQILSEMVPFFQRVSVKGEFFYSTVIEEQTFYAKWTEWGVMIGLKESFGLLRHLSWEKKPEIALTLSPTPPHLIVLNLSGPAAVLLPLVQKFQREVATHLREGPSATQRLAALLRDPDYQIIIKRIAYAKAGPFDADGVVWRAEVWGYDWMLRFLFRQNQLVLHKTRDWWHAGQISLPNNSKVAFSISFGEEEGFSCDGQLITYEVLKNFPSPEMQKMKEAQDELNAYFAQPTYD